MSAGRRPHVPPEVEPQVAASLGVLRASLEELRASFALLADRHADNYEIWGTAIVLAGWIAADEGLLDPLVDRYGIKASRHAHKVGAALLGGRRAGLPGLLADLTDVSLLAQQAEVAWTILAQGAKELGDADMLAAAGRGGNHVERAMRWIRTEVHHTAPEALAAVAAPAASVARRPKRSRRTPVAAVSRRPAD